MSVLDYIFIKKLTNTSTEEYEKQIEEYKQQIGQYEIDLEEATQQADSYMSVLDGTVTEFTTPSSWSEIRNGCFYNCKSLKSINISDNITSINHSAFQSCESLEYVTIPDSVVNFGWGAFYLCYKIKSVILSKNISNLPDCVFQNCNSLKTINIPKSLISIYTTAFKKCTVLEFVTIEDGFNCNNLDLSASTLYSVETLVAMLEALADRSAETTAYTLTLGSTNLAKLTDEQIAIATDKNWTLA